MQQISDSDEEQQSINEGKTTSPGLAQLLRRFGYEPTGDSKSDIETAKKFIMFRSNKNAR